MTAKELRNKYINFFKRHGHTEIPSASLIPENDASVLFTTAGMHPLVPYLLGEKHPAGKRLVNCQKCLRTGDIEEVGDNTHLTFFEMLGNWSLNDYFRKESLSMSFEFLVNDLKLPVEKIHATVFEGDEAVPRDSETYEIWKGLGLDDTHISFQNRKENWWGPVGNTGPCGPDSEIFYDTGKAKCGKGCDPACSCGKYIEIWNNVFMEYNKQEDGSYVKMTARNVDTGLGFERVLAILNEKGSVYETELFAPLLSKIEELTGQKQTESNKKAFRVIADHVRTATFVLGDDKAVTPSNVDQGYILRRIIRRAYRFLKTLSEKQNPLRALAQVVVENYCDVYPELKRNESFIYKSLDDEEALFGKTLDQGLKHAGKFLSLVEKGGMLNSEETFRLYDTFGFPPELTEELALEQNKKVDMVGFKQRFLEHQKKSRAGAEQKFKGGLVDNDERTTKLHTATHLMHAALRRVLGDTVFQRGSNITSERLRFDFSFDRKLTPEELVQVEKLVNEAITTGAEVVCEEMSVTDAKAQGAIGLFEDKYGSKVKVYTMGAFSKEICGGPHAGNTNELGRFKILKEEASSAGVRRIKATLE